MFQGPILLPAASPTLGGLYEDAVKDVTSPENDEESYYDYWSRWSGQEGNFTLEVALKHLKKIALNNIYPLKKVQFFFIRFHPLLELEATMHHFSSMPGSLSWTSFLLR